MLTHCFLVLFALLSSMSVKAQEFHKNHLFIKMKKDVPLKPSVYIKKSQIIIPDLYLVETDHLELLEKEVQKWEVLYLRRDYLSSENPLPAVVSEKGILPQSANEITPHFNDEFINRLWAFKARWGLNVHQAYQKLPLRVPQEIIVAVIDTGVDYLHEDLKNVMWRNEKEIPDDGIDNDQNGYIDDVYGINTLVRTRFTRRATTDPMASDWHGTHVAGIIAAEANNGIGIAGVAPNAKIMAIRAIPDARNESDSHIVESLLYAARQGARIINCSFGKARFDGHVVKDVIESIGKDFGVLVVAAAGNNSQGPGRWYDIDTRPHYPASFNNSNLLTVTASNMKGELSNFSNIGRQSVDLAAPGSQIFSSVKNNKYASSSGTSMAAPQAAGAAAFILGYFPDLSPEELKAILMKSAKKSPHLQGMLKVPGIVNLPQALELARGYRK